ncbi:MAG: pyridoxine 5'-phosphate synthase [Candidatus Binatia bacterium]
MTNTLSLGVNVDHVATIRQARLCEYPDPLEAALAAERGGASGITIHLREDRRHIQERDVLRIRDGAASKLNLEMAATVQMVDFACSAQPPEVCLVPEKREELTTEGGLAVAGREAKLAPFVEKLRLAGIRVSLFVEADESELIASKRVGAQYVELHTGSYANADPGAEAAELEKIRQGAALARELGLGVNGGHGLTLENVEAIAAIPQIVELNIGHSIVARAIMVGIEQATREMLEACLAARRRVSA